MKIILLILYTLIVFAIGGAWLQAKESKFGIQAKYCCERCKSDACQAKWCKERKLRGD